jgi:hypothetical protein
MAEITPMPARALASHGTTASQRRPRIGTRPISTRVAQLRMVELSLSPAMISRASITAGNLRLSVRTIYRMLNGEPVSREKRDALARHLNLSLAELEGAQRVPFFSPDRSSSSSPAQNLPSGGSSAPLASFMLRHGHQSTRDTTHRYLQNLLSIQNADGGWGSEAGVSSSPLNTAEVLLALRHESHCDPSALHRGLCFLRESQDGSGGWHSRRQVPGESITVTSTALCVQAFQSYEAFGTPVVDSGIPKALFWLLTAIDSGLWANTPGALPSVPATAFALQAFAVAYQSRYPCERAILRTAVHRLAGVQGSDGGFPFTPGGPSSVAASLQVMHALLLLPQELLLEDRGILPSIGSFFEGTHPQTLVQTELQENDCIDARGLQFEHFNAASLLLASRYRRIFPEEVLRLALDHMAGMMRSDGCPATPLGLIYSWSTAHCVRALLATIPS